MFCFNVVTICDHLIIVSDNVENCVSFFQLTHMSRWYLVVLVWAYRLGGCRTRL
jgi:hypothetical protein